METAKCEICGSIAKKIDGFFICDSCHARWAADAKSLSDVPLLKMTINTIQRRELGQGATAETSITTKQMLALAKSYMAAGQRRQAEKMIQDALQANPTCAEILWHQLLFKHRVSNGIDLLKKLPEFTQDDFLTIEKILDLAEKSFASKILDLLYQANRLVPDEVYHTLLKIILPYNYERRDEKLDQAFTHAIAKDNFPLFRTLLSALANDDIDSFIRYNTDYAYWSKSLRYKQICLESILKIDENNIETLKAVLLLRLGSLDAHEAGLALERILKLSPSPMQELDNILNKLAKILETPSHCAFAKQFLQYAEDLAEVENSMTALAQKMIQCGFFEDAQHLLQLILSVDPQSEDAYWGLCLIKLKARTQQEAITSHTPLSSIPEYQKYLTLVDESKRQSLIALEIEQESHRKHKKAKKIAIWTASITCAMALLVLLSVFWIIPSFLYSKAHTLLSRGEFEKGYSCLLRIPDYKDISDLTEQFRERTLLYIDQNIEEGNYQKAYEAATALRLSASDHSLIEGLNALVDGDYKKAATFGFSRIVIPEGTTAIEDSAFVDCKNLEEVIIPDSVTSIGMGAFSGCENLSTLTIPASVTSIGSRAFASTNIESLCFSGTMKQWEKVEKGTWIMAGRSSYSVVCSDGTIIVE